MRFASTLEGIYRRSGNLLLLWCFTWSHLSQNHMRSYKYIFYIYVYRCGQINQGDGRHNNHLADRKAANRERRDRDLCDNKRSNNEEPRRRWIAWDLCVARVVWSINSKITSATSLLKEQRTRLMCLKHDWILNSRIEKDKTLWTEYESRSYSVGALCEDEDWLALLFGAECMRDCGVSGTALLYSQHTDHSYLRFMFVFHEAAQDHILWLALHTRHTTESCV